MICKNNLFVYNPIHWGKIIKNQTDSVIFAFGRSDGITSRQDNKK